MFALMVEGTPPYIDTYLFVINIGYLLQRLIVKEETTRPSDAISLRRLCWRLAIHYSRVFGEGTFSNAVL
jgi:hypothetical protein